MIESTLAKEKEEKAEQEAAKASALKGMFSKIEQGQLCNCIMPDLPQAIEKSLQMGKTPLLLDHTVVSATHPQNLVFAQHICWIQCIASAVFTKLIGNNRGHCLG